MFVPNCFVVIWPIQKQLPKHTQNKPLAPARVRKRPAAADAKPAESAGKQGEQQGDAELDEHDQPDKASVEEDEAEQDFEEANGGGEEEPRTSDPPEDDSADIECPWAQKFGLRQDSGGGHDVVNRENCRCSSVRE